METALNGAFAVALNAHNYDSNEITVSGLVSHTSMLNPFLGFIALF